MEKEAWSRGGELQKVIGYSSAALWSWCGCDTCAPTEPLLCKFADGGQKKRQSQSKYPQNGRPWHREGESGMTLTYDPSAMQNGFYSSPYSISTNRMIAQTSITPYITASPVSTYQGAVITPNMDHTISMQQANMMGPLSQQMNHMSLGTTGTYMTAAAAPMQGTYIPQYTPVPASAVSMEGVVTEASPQSVPSSQDAGGQQPLGMDNASDHVPTYSFQSANFPRAIVGDITQALFFPMFPFPLSRYDELHSGSAGQIGCHSVSLDNMDKQWQCDVFMRPGQHRWALGFLLRSESRCTSVFANVNDTLRLIWDQ
ncbi:RNA-binding motif, single-stranded-interacting protein 3 [Triplophysa tibetana]|uniref:RNA-binding motif, single-stranded-interacting protein 3 n=1 Tax=Triplophysa tibetana TaxID=1572043 RepID=A0A5A9N0I9_9TELE|nr:RNA-binding motif, single-stranded-interacting protein 3 [Triplophysa tibetana]